MLGLRLQRYSTNPEKYPLLKLLEILNLSSQPELPGEKEILHIIYPLAVTLHEVFKSSKTLPFSGNTKWKNKFRDLKNFSRRYLFVFVDYLYNRSPKIRTNNFEFVFQF